MVARTRAGRVRVRNEGVWGRRRRPSLRLAGADDWHFTDFVPPPLLGTVGELAVSVRVWPPDCIPSFPEARRVVSGRLAGFWVAVEFP